jgi:hypothetical protein
MYSVDMKSRIRPGAYGIGIGIGNVLSSDSAASFSRGVKSDGARGQQGRAANDGVELHTQENKVNH